MQPVDFYHPDLIRDFYAGRQQQSVWTEPEQVGQLWNVPIYLVYFTAWVSDDGILQFRNDVYKKDKELAMSSQ